MPGPGGRVVVLVEHGLGGTGEASPERGVDVPVQDTVGLGRISEAAAALVQEAADNREGVPAHEHAVVVEPETAGHHVEEVADVLSRRFQGVLEIRHLHRVQRAEFGPAGRDGGRVAQQPVQVEGKSFFLPPVQVGAHGRAGFRPVRALLGQREVALGQLRPAGVDPVEDIHHHVDGLVLAGDLLLVEVAFEHLPEPGQPLHVRDDPRLGIRVRVQRPDVLLEALREQRGDIDPSRVIAHLGRRVELERLILDVEAQPGERLLVALEEGGRPSAGDAVEGRDPLLAIQDQHPEGGGCRGLAADQRAVRQGLPGEQAANRIPEVQGAHQPADLVAVPHVATLELGQQHASRIDLVKNSGQLGHDLSLAVPQNAAEYSHSAQAALGPST